MRRLLRRFSPLIGLVLLLAALWTLRRELQTLTLVQLSTAVRAIPLSRMAAALLLTALNYLFVTGYDQLAFIHLRRRFPPWQITVASFVGYAISNNVGFALLSGTSARYRFYSRWGLTAQEISRIIIFYSGTFWLGLLVLGGWSLLVISPERLGGPTIALWLRPAGATLLAIPIAYAIASVIWRGPIRIGPVVTSLPRPALVAAQFALSILDWGLAVGTLWVLLPPPRLPFAHATAAFAGAQLVGLASHVPGGIGVFESLMVLMLKPDVEAAVLLPALLAFRVIYYVLPFGVAFVVLLVDEFFQRRHLVARWGNAFGTLTESIAPKVLAVFTFIAGGVLLFSGATPASPARLRLIGDILPLPVVEASHFIGSLLGLMLLLLSQGLARRLDAAYVLTTVALGAGAAASLFKGGDYEEAALLVALLAVLLPARARFDRKAALFDRSFSRMWLSAVVAVVAASVWLGEFAFQHVQYTNELWWRFEVDQDASRSLRAAVGVCVALLVVGIRQLLKPAIPELPLPSEAELAEAGVAITTQEATQPYLAYLADKSLLWNEDRTAFVMYGVQRRTWVALGDPVGPPDCVADLVRRFLERVDDVDGIPVFYEVHKEWLHAYADFGLTFMKLGEEARVRLDSFSLAGASHKSIRNTVRRVEKEGATFRVVQAQDLTGILPALREVSDEWLAGKSGAEKGFSLGFFDERYVARFPVAVLERNGRIEAFANLWEGPARVELSIDLMRYRDSSPPGCMEALFAHAMLWGKEQGYRWFNLGMAPLSGLQRSDVAPLWVRLGSYVYRHGETFYNFKGLRAYKEKFDPVWEPRYLAYPGGLALPQVLADVSVLIAGGYRRFLLRDRVPRASRPRTPAA